MLNVSVDRCLCLIKVFDFFYLFSSYVDTYDLPDPCDNVDIVLRYIACKMKYETGGTFLVFAIFNTHIVFVNRTKV